MFTLWELVDAFANVHGFDLGIPGLIVLPYIPGLVAEAYEMELFVVPLSVGFGLAMGLVFGVVRPSQQPPTPASSLDSNRMVSIITLLMVCLSLALVSDPLLGLGIGRTFFFSGLGGVFWVVGLGMVPIALLLAAVSPWSVYQLAHGRLALRGRLPWRLFAFLEDAHQRGVIRQVGGVYQFRHARLQDRLAGP